MEKLIKSDDPRMLTAPKPVSALAILALVVGVLGCLYIINSQLVLIPVLAIAISLIALVRIQTKDGLGGLWLVTVSLFLAAFSLTVVGTYKIARHQHLVGYAKKHADTWLELARDGEIFKTHQLTKEYPKRCAPDVNLETFYIGRNTNNLELEHYITLQPDISMREDGDGCNWVNEGMIDYTIEPRKENFVMQFRLKRASASAPDQVFLLQMKRTDHLPPLGPQWTCSAIQNIDPPFERPLLGFIGEDEQ